jgi:quercetin dioxygenase-like cupin family protein
LPSQPFITHEDLCPLEGWDDPVRGAVQWRTLLSGEHTPTDSLTMGVAMVTGTERRLHRHAQPEAYYVLSGEGVLHIDGTERQLTAGAAAFIPGGALHGAWRTGDATLRLLYVFAADAFDQIHYEFPGETS